jgi:flagellar biosynthetic protein FliQ
MNIDAVNVIIGNAIQVILITSLPSVGLGLIVGVVIAVIQAVTQVQEQTLTFVPKMIVLFLVLAATFPWMTRVLMDLSINLWSNIPLYAR